MAGAEYMQEYMSFNIISDGDVLYDAVIQERGAEGTPAVHPQGKVCLPRDLAKIIPISWRSRRTISERALHRNLCPEEDIIFHR